MPRVAFTRATREDPIGIWMRGAAGDPVAADRILDSLDGAARHLASNPRMGPARDDIRPGLRYLVSGPCLLLDRSNADEIENVRAVHGRRDLCGLI